MSGRLIIASNRLPVSVAETNTGLTLTRSNGGLATALASLFQQNTSLWVGWTGMPRHLTETELSTLTFPPYLSPVNITHDEIHRYYEGFSNSIFWPLAHGLQPTIQFTPHLWHAVQTVTQKFADRIVMPITDSDTIWIHDYHLLLLPGELRRRGIKRPIGFFLHSPVLSPSRLAQLPHAETLFRNLMQADVVGVQTEDDAKRLRRILRMLSITPRGIIKAFPIGIDANEFATLAASHEVQRLAKQHKTELNNRKCIFSLSRLDYTKGIMTQLSAFKQLLIDHPELHNKIIYRLNIAPSREAMLEYRELKQTAEALVATINKRFGSLSWQPINYSYVNMNPTEFTAWYEVGDVHLNTPIADGMNLIAKEYIAGRTHPGTLVISSTMGAAKRLTDALIVPPKSIKKTSEALYAALTMKAGEKEHRWQSLTRAVTTHQAADWARDFLDELDKQVS